MKPRFRLEVFEGPLDLLLHLIQREEIDLERLPIARITDQYLEYLGILEDLNLDLAGEYLVMAATLVHLKARLLLPEEESDEPPLEEEIQDLKDQLAEYRRYKDAADRLADRNLLSWDVFRKPPEIAPDVGDEPAPLRPHQVEDLIGALREVLRRIPAKRPHPVERERVSLADRVRHVLQALRRGPVEFTRLFGDEPTRNEVVVTFLALLELVRRGIAGARQEIRFGPIELRLVSDLTDDEAVAIQDEYGEG